MKKKIIILGSGVAGYNCALNLAKLGEKPTLIEKNEIGGTCVNRGCIPTKVLTTYRDYVSELNKLNEVSNAKLLPEIDINKMNNKIEDVVSTIRSNVEKMLKKEKIEIIKGLATFKDNKTLNIQTEEGNQEIEGEKIIIACGSSVKTEMPFDVDEGVVIENTDTFLKIKKIPETMVIIGGGPVGIEFASIYNRLFDTSIIVIEALPHILNVFDSSTQKYYESLLKRKGIKIIKDSVVKKLSKNGNGYKVIYAENNDGEEAELDCDTILSAFGRQRNTDSLNLASTDIKVNKNGSIAVDKYLQTNVDGIYALGDIIEGPMLANQAIFEAAVIANNVVKGNTKIQETKYTPNVVFSSPEIASVGEFEEELFEKELKDKENIKSTRLPFGAVGKSIVYGERDGNIRIVHNGKHIFGCSIIGKGVSELISIVTPLIKNRIPIEEIKKMNFPHPTLSELIYEVVHSIK